MNEKWHAIMRLISKDTSDFISTIIHFFSLIHDYHCIYSETCIIHLLNDDIQITLDNNEWNKTQTFTTSNRCLDAIKSDFITLPFCTIICYVQIFTITS